MRGPVAVSDGDGARASSGSFGVWPRSSAQLSPLGGARSSVECSYTAAERGRSATFCIGPSSDACGTHVTPGPGAVKTHGVAPAPGKGPRKAARRTTN